MIDINIFKQHFEEYKNANTQDKRKEIIEKVKNEIKNASFREKKEILKLAISIGIDDIFDK